MTSSAATEPRALCVRPPHDCATGSALVLKCVCMKQHPKFFLCRFWNHFSLLLLFKGVGPRRITVRTGCLGLSFWVLSTNWHGIMCILNSYMRASYSCISWRASPRASLLCIMMYASLSRHHGKCIMSYAPFCFVHGTFHHGTTLALHWYK